MSEELREDDLEQVSGGAQGSVPVVGRVVEVIGGGRYRIELKGVTLEGRCGTNMDINCGDNVLVNVNGNSCVIIKKY